MHGHAWPCKAMHDHAKVGNNGMGLLVLRGVVGMRSWAWRVWWNGLVVKPRETVGMIMV